MKIIPAHSLAVCQWSLPSMPPEEIARALNSLGLRGIQLDAGNWDGKSLALSDSLLQDRWLASCAESGLEIPVLGSGALLSEGMSRREKAPVVRSILEEMVAIAVNLDIPILQLPSFVDGEIDTEDHLTATADSLRFVCDLVAGTDIAVGTENSLDAGANERLFALVDRKNLRVFFDTQNPHRTGLYPAALLEAQYGLLCDAVHLKDGSPEKGAVSPLGEGDSGFFETFGVLRRNGYSGWYVFENDYRRSLSGPTWESCLEKDVATVIGALE